MHTQEFLDALFVCNFCEDAAVRYVRMKQGVKVQAAGTKDKLKEVWAWDDPAVNRILQNDSFIGRVVTPAGQVTAPGQAPFRRRELLVRMHNSPIPRESLLKRIFFLKKMLNDIQKNDALRQTGVQIDEANYFWPNTSDPEHLKMLCEFQPVDLRLVSGLQLTDGL